MLLPKAARRSHFKRLLFRRSRIWFFFLLVSQLFHNFF